MHSVLIAVAPDVQIALAPDAQIAPAAMVQEVGETAVLLGTAAAMATVVGAMTPAGVETPTGDRIDAATAAPRDDVAAPRDDVAAPRDEATAPTDATMVHRRDVGVLNDKMTAAPAAAASHRSAAVPRTGPNGARDLLAGLTSRSMKSQSKLPAEPTGAALRAGVHLCSDPFRVRIEATPTQQACRPAASSVPSNWRILNGCPLKLAARVAAVPRMHGVGHARRCGWMFRSWIRRRCETCRSPNGNG